MRDGVFGGTFDPPHLGHAMACLWALESGEIDRVLMIPVGRHPFGKKTVATFEQRLEMCRLAVARLGEDVIISDIEGRRTGTTYMVDTLRELHKEYAGAELRLLAGTDVAGEIHKWHEGEEVLRLAPILEIPRPLSGETFADRPGALPPISSSDVRRSIAEGKPVHHYLSYSIRGYISSFHLYQEEQIENSQR